MSLNDWAYTPEEQEKLNEEADLNNHIVLEGEIEGQLQLMKAAEVQYDDLNNVFTALQEQGGMSRAVAQEAALILPGFCKGARPTEFTELPSMQNYKTALEELSLGMAAAIAAGFAALALILNKFISWLFGGGGGSTGGGGGGGSEGGAITRGRKSVETINDVTDKIASVGVSMDLRFETKNLVIKEGYPKAGKNFRSNGEFLLWFAQEGLKAPKDSDLSKDYQRYVTAGEPLLNPIEMDIASDAKDGPWAYLTKNISKVKQSYRKMLDTIDDIGVILDKAHVLIKTYEKNPSGNLDKELNEYESVYERLDGILENEDARFLLDFRDMFNNKRLVAAQKVTSEKIRVLTLVYSAKNLEDVSKSLTQSEIWTDVLDIISDGEKDLSKLSGDISELIKEINQLTENVKDERPNYSKISKPMHTLRKDLNLFFKIFTHSTTTYVGYLKQVADMFKKAEHLLEMNETFIKKYLVEAKD